MRSVETHRTALLELVARLDEQTVAAADAVGRALARPVIAAVDSPPFANAEMDGYAVRSDAGGAGWWRVGQDIAAGMAPAPLADGTVARIMTGAPMPLGADAVVPVEATDGGLQRVRIDAWAEPGRFVRPRGSDVRQGDEVVPAGRVLRPVDVAAAVAVGRSTLTVTRAPRVAVISTGDELRSPGEALTHGAIYDANSISLAALVRAWGGEVVAAATVRDDARAIEQALAGLDADLIVTSGGVSAGAYDVVKALLRERGVAFGPVAMQPGKPQGWGVLDGVPIVCAPGNPVSAVVTFVVFVAPMLCEMQGLPAPRPERMRVAQGWASPVGRAQFMPVRVASEGVRPAAPGGSRSALIASLAAADALAAVSARAREVTTGDSVAVMRFTP